VDTLRKTRIEVYFSKNFGISNIKTKEIIKNKVKTKKISKNERMLVLPIEYLIIGINVSNNNQLSSIIVSRFCISPNEGKSLLMTKKTSKRIIKNKRETLEIQNIKYEKFKFTFNELNLTNIKVVNPEKAATSKLGIKKFLKIRFDVCVFFICIIIFSLLLLED